MSRQNDPTLLDEYVVYRRIPPWPDNTRWLDDGSPEASRQNFKDYPEHELSVHLVHETTPEKMLAGHQQFGLMTLTIADFRAAYAEFGSEVVICRDDEDPSNGHILICGKPSKRIQARLREKAKWVPGRWPAKLS